MPTNPTPPVGSIDRTGAVFYEIERLVALRDEIERFVALRIEGSLSGEDASRFIENALSGFQLSGLQAITRPGEVAPLPLIARSHPYLGRGVDENILVVVGGGNMGSGIAYAALSAGYEVRIYEMSDEAAERAQGKIEELIQKGVGKKKISAEEADAMRRFFSVYSPSTPLRQVVANAGLVIEAIFEDFDAKTTLFQELAEVAHSDTLLVSNTSSFRIGDLAKASGAEGRLVGAHFFYPPYVNRLLELIVPGDANDPANQEAKLRLLTFGRRLGKVTISAPDSPGFIVNRFFVPWLNEAARLLEAIVYRSEPNLNLNRSDIPHIIALIDSVAKEAFGVGMGPFKLMNVTGVPIALHAAEALAKELGDFYQPSNLLREQVGEKKDWEVPPTADEEEVLLRTLEEKVSAEQVAQWREQIRNKFSSAVSYAISDLINEHPDPQIGSQLTEDIGIGASVGLAWKEGVIQQVNSNVHFQFNPETGIARIQVMRPAKRNALNGEVVRALSKALDQLEQTEGVKTVVFEGLGGDFGAGADLNFFVQHLRRREIDPILDFTREGLEVFDRIAALKGNGIRAIAVVDGAAWGGGFEMALAVGEIVVTPEAEFALPETLLGIAPGLRGGARLAQRIGSFPSMIVQSTTSAQKPITGEEAFAMGIADHLVSREDLDRMLESGKFPPVDSERPLRASMYWGIYQDMAERYYFAARRGIVQDLIARREIKFSDFIPDADKAGELQALYDDLLARSKGRPRSALEVAESLTRLDFVFPSNDERLLATLRKMFENPIALEGLSAAVERRRPNFAQFEAASAPTEGGPVATVSQGLGEPWEDRLERTLGDPNFNPALRIDHDPANLAATRAGIFATTFEPVSAGSGAQENPELDLVVRKTRGVFGEVKRALRRGEQTEEKKALLKEIGRIDHVFSRALAGDQGVSLFVVGTVIGELVDAFRVHGIPLPQRGRLLQQAGRFKDLGYEKVLSSPPLPAVDTYEAFTQSNDLLRRGEREAVRLGDDQSALVFARGVRIFRKVCEGNKISEKNAGQLLRSLTYLWQSHYYPAGGKPRMAIAVKWVLRELEKVIAGSSGISPPVVVAQNPTEGGPTAKVTVLDEEDDRGGEESSGRSFLVNGGLVYGMPAHFGRTMAARRAVSLRALVRSSLL